MWRYWSFYWPLLLTSMVIQFESQFQNRTLAQYAADGCELAVFANASSAYHSLNALLTFVPQLVTVMAVGAVAARRCQRFVLGFALALALPLMGLAFTAPGGAALTAVFGVPPEQVGAVQGYLMWLAPLIVVGAQIFHNVGRLLQARRTKLITRLNIFHMAILVAGLQLGLWLGWRSVVTLAVATIVANLAHWAASEWAARRSPVPAAPAAGGGGDAAAAGPAGYRDLWAFYWPMAITGVLFAVSRPIIYRYVNFLPAAESMAIIAALRVAFDAGFIFQAPVNQLRHLFTTFPEAELPRVRRFSLLVAGAYTLLIAVVAFTPLSRWYFGGMLDLKGRVMTMAVGAFAALTLNPLITALRNVFQADLINRRHTGGMALGALLRAGIIWALSMACYYGGVLNHYTGAALMLSGFAIEAATSWVAVRRLRRADAAGAA